MTKDEIVMNDLVCEIRTFNEIDDSDYDETFFGMKHPGMSPWQRTGAKIEFSDWNCHQGPMLFVDHLDTNKYNVEKCCTTWFVDYGISFVSRK